MGDGAEPGALAETRDPSDRGRRLVRGGLVVGLASVAVRGASLLSQLVLGRLLLPADFGVFAIALTFSTVAAAANSVLRSFLVDAMKRDRDVDGLYRLVVRVTLVVTALFVVATPLMAWPFDEPGLTRLLLVLNLSMPLQVLPALGAARLTRDLRFGDLSKLWTLGAVSRQIVTVTAALAGMGAMSFVAGVVLGSAVEWGVARWATGPAPRWRGPIGPAPTGAHRADLRLVPLSIVVLALWINGDYAAAGLFESATIVGVYFFAYQLTSALTQPFTLAVSSVLLPRFGHGDVDDDEREAFRTAVLLVPLLSGLPFGLLTVLAAPFTDLVWAGRWNLAIEAIILLALVTPLKLLLSTSLSILQARGDWSGYSRLLSAAALGAVGTAAVGGMIGGVRGLAATMAVGTMAMGALGLDRTGRSFGLTAMDSLREPLVCWAAWVFAVVLAGVVAPMGDQRLGAAPLRVLTFLLASVPVVYVLYGDQLATLWRVAAGGALRSAAPAPSPVPIPVERRVAVGGQVRDRRSGLESSPALRRLEEALATRPEVGWTLAGAEPPPPVHREIRRVLTDG